MTKTPGPTGYSTLREPLEEAKTIASTQVIPRDALLTWATVYLRVANMLDSLATFVRCGARSDVGEFTEGGAEHRVGSSAMPGKRNPIQSERVCGLARVARGYFLSLAEVSNLWEDRDLSNSATERIAVPGLAGTVEYMVTEMTAVIRDLGVDIARMRLNAEHPRAQAAAMQAALQKQEMISPLEASRRVAQMMEEQ